MPLPAMFVGSSKEGLKVAKAIQVGFDGVCETELWTQGVFGLSGGTLESLVTALSRFDFAVLALTADDLTISRGSKKPSARDNVLFELGLFMGALGRERTFVLFDRTNAPRIPSDLAGVTLASFAPHATGNLVAALGAPCSQIQEAVEKLGPRPDRAVHTVPRSRVFSFDDVKHFVGKVHRRIENEFEPDVIVTMSGPGSIAACYLWQINTRNVPLFVATTFPKARSGKRSPKGFQLFAAASARRRWRRISTKKWEIFLPDLLFGFPPGTKVVIFDDRVLSGESQIELHKQLSAQRYAVKRAAMFSASAQAATLDWVGQVTDEDFNLPWGAKDGRY